MTWNRVVLLAVVAVSAVLVLAGCTDQSTRANLTVVDVNGGRVYYSDVISDSGTVVADEVVLTLGNIQNDGLGPLEPGAPFSEIFVTGYTVTFDNGVYPPVSGGVSAIVRSGGTTEVAIALSDIGAKAALPVNIATSTTARITVSGIVHANGGNNGDGVSANASLPVQVANFKDADLKN
jgi:hypothetical protein